MISAKIVLDSISPLGKRITTFSLEYPRFIHAEFMTHRLFSRNASSSRAIPVVKMLERVKEDPAIPIHWGKNQPGMQAKEELTGDELEMAKRVWLLARDQAVIHVEVLIAYGLHKQVANRILEPWMYVNAVCTSTEWGNWFNLRLHPDAQPEIQALAKAMWDALRESTPQQLWYGDWHLPYLTTNDAHLEPITKKKISAARCARVSYLTHEGKQPILAEDMDLFERLMRSTPKHASPTEHQAMPWNGRAGDGNLQGNFKGWIQFRKTLIDECLPEFNGPV